MKYWKEYRGHEYEIVGKREKIDNTIYTFDIETTSYVILNGKVYAGIEYLNLTDEEKASCIKQSCMYIWMFSINEVVYFGRTWKEFQNFIDTLEFYSPLKKIIFVHNLSFEFQCIKKYFIFRTVTARKKHKVMKAELDDYNIEFRCSYFMSNASLSQLPKLFNLPVQKKVGDLDYTKLRNSKTELTEKELGYCEYDCLVVYHFIIKELEEYGNVKNIPLTSTGHVRRELKELTMRDYSYRRKVNKAINTNPCVYNLLVEAFAGGYTHANWIYVDEILKNIDSWDFTSSYPFVLVTEKYPSTEFKKCNITKKEDMLECFAYLIKVRFYNISSKYYNNFISSSKCTYIKGGVYDNGRLIKAEEIEITLTDIDFNFLCDSHKYEKYLIEECYYSLYNYLPKLFIDFVLDKYVLKTQYKGVSGKELEYSKEKNKFNALYGMSVTNLIRAKVEYDNILDWTDEIELTNEEIEEMLNSEKQKSFLSFAYGVWVTAYARRNLLENVCKLDEYVVYCDTDSIKLLDGYDKSVIETYNKKVINKIKVVSDFLGIDMNKYMPNDKKGIKHVLGVFDNDGHYDEFVTQGAKKYAYRQYENIYGFKKDYCFRKEHNLHITVAGVPKSGVKALKNDIRNFKDNLIFDFKDTNKNILIYADNQISVELTDYQGNTEMVKDKSGCCLLPTTYILGKAIEYASLVEDDTTKRAKYKL